MKKIVLMIVAVLLVCSADAQAAADMVLIPGGEFEMGDHHDGMTNALPVHSVYVDSFYMSRYEVTNQQYCDYLNAAYPDQVKVVNDIVYAISDTGNNYPYCDTQSSHPRSQIYFSGGAFNVRIKDGIDMSNHPMMMVSWYGAVAYCDFYGYRLPTEAEWEYAARGGENNPYYRYPWGDSIDSSKANYWQSNDPYETGAQPWTTPVGDYSANGYGLYDMSGNVWEWCNDWYDSTYYAISPYDNPQGPDIPDPPDFCVIRGGGWDISTGNWRVASRTGNNRDNRSSQVGFRVASIPEPAITETAVDIDPDTLNLQSKGKWITCYIWLPEEYEVADVDPDSILLNGEISATWSWIDEAEQMLMAKFSRSEVQDILEQGEVELTVTGELLDGTKFEGSDTIRVIDKGGKK